jgi:predicted MPP superfamily phosphohydrolase/energy-coupling factor transporter ATP-binding protein EcfA2
MTGSDPASPERVGAEISPLGPWLGQQGEERARAALDAYELDSGLSIYVITSGHATALAELRRRLASAATDLYDIRADGQLVAELYRLVSGQAGGAGGEPLEGRQRPLIWISQSGFDERAWREALASLNQRREALRLDLAAMLVVAGPPEVTGLFADNAPDFYANRRSDWELPEAPYERRASAHRPLRWLHLSDFHFRSDQQWEQRPILEALLRELGDLDHDERPDLVFLTGDIAHRGKRAEYEQAERFFAQLAETLELDPRERFFVVPGNHDVDRSAIGPGDKPILDQIKSQRELANVLGHRQTRELLGARLKEFYAFSERLLGSARALSLTRPWRGELVDLDGLAVGVLSLNSAWASSSAEDRGRLLIGEHQLRDALDQLPSVPITVALAHHPLSALRDFDEGRCREQLQSLPGLTFLLRGHLHENATSSMLTPTGWLIETAAGAVYTNDDWPKRYLRASVDRHKGIVRFALRRYSERAQGFWTTDSESYQGAEDGVVSLPLPQEPTQTADVPPGELTTAQFEAHAERYRQVTTTVLARARFIGLPFHGPAPNARVAELFVPLRFAPARETLGGKDAATTDVAELAQQLRGGRRIALLGEPGSGKTTLCRYLLALFAGETELADVTLPFPSPIPILLPLRSLKLGAEQPPALIDVMRTQARDHLSLSLPEGFFERALESGRAIVLVDGLDEVGDDATRETVRDQLVGLAIHHRRIGLLVTSRPTGYDKTPLATERPHTVHTARTFDELRIDPLDEEQQEAFCHAWYRLREPDDVNEREQGAARLIAALAAEPSARELARNPLLLTLIALIHRSEARLPGRRVKLYDACVRCLLETWPAASKRTFDAIEPELQRLYLEDLALRMQEGRKTFGSSNVTIESSALQQALIEVIKSHNTANTSGLQTKRLVERWIVHLCSRSGILVEQQPRQFAFVHLTLMEFLAACALQRHHTQTELVGLIAGKLNEPAWIECLLLLGAREADEPRFATAVIEAVEATEPKPKHGYEWIRLLRMAADEVCFSSEQLELLLERAAKQSLWSRLNGSLEWRSAEVVGLLIEHSRRHGVVAHDWWKRRLETATDKRLLEAVALVDSQESVDLVSRRPDAEGEPARAALSFWPMPKISRWAASHASSEAALAWACAARSDGLLVTTWLILLFGDECGRLPAAQAVNLHRLFAPAAKEAVNGFRINGSRSPDRSFQLLLNMTRYSPDLFITKGNVLLTQQQFLEGAVGHSLLFENADHVRAVDVATLDSLLLARLSEQNTAQRPDGTSLTDDQALWARGAAWVDRELAPEVLHGIVLAAERGSRGARFINDADHRLLRNHVVARAQAPLWHELEPRWCELHDYELALALALGWTQYVMVGLWPATPGWIAALSGDPPSHWLARAQWHQCWLAYDREDEAAKAGLEAALAAGRSDPELPGYAEHLARGLEEAARVVAELEQPIGQEQPSS